MFIRTLRSLRLICLSNVTGELVLLPSRHLDSISRQTTNVIPLLSHYIARNDRREVVIAVTQYNDDYRFEKNNDIQIYHCKGSQVLRQ